MALPGQVGVQSRDSDGAMLLRRVYMMGAIMPGVPLFLFAGYLSLFEESRLVHISTIDCAILAALCPFWMSNDAEVRDWKDR